MHQPITSLAVPSVEATCRVESAAPVQGRIILGWNQRQSSQTLMSQPAVSRRVLGAEGSPRQEAVMRRPTRRTKAGQPLHIRPYNTTAYILHQTVTIILLPSGIQPYTFLL